MYRVVESDVDEIWGKIDITEIAGKSVLITGGTGLLGSYFIYTIKKLNESIQNKTKVLFVVHKDIPPFLSFIESTDWISIFRGDLTNMDFCNSLPNADYIIHAAGYGQPGLFMSDKLNTIRVNTLSTDILLEKLNKGGKFLYISTSEIYSGSEAYPYLEDECGRTNPQHPRSCYIEGKRCGEAICMANIEKGKNVKIARVSLAYGPCFKKDDKRVIYDFIRKADDGLISLLDRGEARRVYCYVNDAIELLWKILLDGKENVYNVGGDSHTTIYNLAELIGKEFSVKIQIPKTGNGMMDAPKVVYMSVDKVKEEFGKESFISLEDGVKRTINWYRDTYC